MEVIRGWTHRAFPVGDASRVGEARRHAAALAAGLGWGEEDAGRAGLVVTELATNLLRHARAGELWMAARTAFDDIEFICVDRGPGMPDIAHCMRDGVSTGTGSPGTGLGAISRMADDFELVSDPAGTVCLVRVRPARSRRPGLSRRLGAVCLAVPPETISGDAWAVRQAGARTDVLVVDGLGHGPLAGYAAQAALDAFQSQADMALEAMLLDTHEALRGTRGAAVLLVRSEGGALRSCGAGNVAGRCFNGVADRSLAGQHGTAGVQVSTPRAMGAEPLPHGVLVLHSDGISTRWKSSDYAGMLGKDPGLLAACILWQHTRGRDDATVVVLKGEGGDGDSCAGAPRRHG